MFRHWLLHQTNWMDVEANFFELRIIFFVSKNFYSRFKSFSFTFPIKHFEQIINRLLFLSNAQYSEVCFFKQALLRPLLSNYLGVFFLFKIGFQVGRQESCGCAIQRCFLFVIVVVIGIGCCIFFSILVWLLFREWFNNRWSYELKSIMIGDHYENEK